MLIAAGCGGVDFQNVDFNLPDDSSGPDYGAPTP